MATPAAPLPRLVGGHPFGQSLAESGTQDRQVAQSGGMSLVVGRRSTVPARTGSATAVLAAALLLAAAQVAAIDRVWQDCGVSGQVDFARGQLIAVCLPALTFANALLIGLPAAVYGPRRGHTLTRALLTATCILVLLFSETLLLARYVATPSPQTASTCVANIPSWWPTWLPA